jgi:predicted Zn-dependent peptidase
MKLSPLTSWALLLSVILSPAILNFSDGSAIPRSTLKAEEPAPAEKPPHSEVSGGALDKLDQNVRRYTLANGMRVVFYRRGVAPVFSGALVVRVGGSDELPGDTGISHMLEHMAFKGTKTIGTKDYSKERPLLERYESIMHQLGGQIERASAEQQRELATLQEQLSQLWDADALTREFTVSGGSSLNATTDKELTRYFVSLPRSAFEFWCRIESERLFAPVLRQFYQERDVVLEERRMRYEDDPGGKLYEQLLAIAFGEHSYRNPVIGYERDLRQLTATRVAAFHKRYYVPSNMVLGIVGDVDPEKDIALVRKYFETIPVGPEVARPAVVEPQQLGERRFQLELASSPELFVAYRKPQYPDRDDAPLSLLLEILAGNSISPLYVELVKRTQIASGVSYTEVPGRAFPNLALFTISPRAPHSTSEVLRSFDQVLRKVQSAGVTEEQLAIAKRGIAVEYLAHLKSDLGLALDFASSELLYGDWRALIDWYNQAQNVTVADVNRVARKYLIPSARTIGSIERKTQTQESNS